MCSWPLLESRDTVCWVHSAVEPTGSSRALEEAGFDGFVEAQCAPIFADGVGRLSLAPGCYFPLLLLGYFEGLDSERAIAWRASGILTPTRAELARLDGKRAEEGDQR